LGLLAPFTHYSFNFWNALCVPLHIFLLNFVQVRSLVTLVVCGMSPLLNSFVWAVHSFLPCFIRRPICLTDGSCALRSPPPSVSMTSSPRPLFGQIHRSPFDQAYSFLPLPDSSAAHLFFFPFLSYESSVVDAPPNRCFCPGLNRLRLSPIYWFEVPYLCFLRSGRLTQSYWLRIPAPTFSWFSLVPLT